MSSRIPPRGLPDGSPVNTKRKKMSPGDRAREARRLADRLENTARQRQAGWAEGDHPNVTHTTTAELTALHRDKRVMRRDIYRAAPHLEGQPVMKGQPGGRP